MAIDQDGKPCTIVLHDDRVNRVDILAGNRVLHVGEFAWLTGPGAKKLCICPAGLANNSTEISIHITLAKRFGFENRTEGRLQLIEDVDAATATHVELFFRDQYLSRADMWQLMGFVQDTVVYQGQIMKYFGTETAEVKKVYISGKEVQSAISSHPHTKPIFRSGSARYTILVEVSQEMLENWTNGELMYERLIDGFLTELFRRWEALKVRHQVTVVLFGREHSSDKQRNETHQDFFHVLVSEVPSTSRSLILSSLKRAFNDPRLTHSISLAAESNLLEAIHLTAMDYADDQTDAHLNSTGMSIIAVTAGIGVFDADHTLLKQTTELLVGNSVGVDIVALSPRPLHPVPLFKYEHNNTSEFALPHWVDISFWHDVRDQQDSGWNLSAVDGPVNDISIPLLRDGGWQEVDAAVMNHHDDEVFNEGSVKQESKVNLTSADITHTNLDVAGSVDTMRAAPTLNSSPPASPAPDERPRPVSIVSSPAETPQLERPKRQRLTRHPLMQTGRKISVGPQGLAPGRGLASTTISTTNALPDKDGLLVSSPAAKDLHSGAAKAIRASLARQPSMQSLASTRISEPEDSTNTRPININTGHELAKDSLAGSDPASRLEQKIAETTVGTFLENDTSLSTTPKASGGLLRKGSLDDTLDMMSPWVMLLNPCNPRRDNMKVASQYRKWQHVFPRAISAGAFKWSSMTSPAALPLTAEYKPSASELKSHYTMIPRQHQISKSSLRDEAAQTLVERLINTRLVRGFQIVAIRDSGSDQTYQSKDKPTLMSLGRRYHEIQRVSDLSVQIVRYEPKIGIGSEFEADRHYLTSYEPRMRMTTGATIKPEVTYHFEAPIVDWTSLDAHILGLGDMPDLNVTFKIRLVLIPIELSANTRLDGFTEEERRIEGIQKLTQTWQRQRHFSAKEQQHHVSLARPDAPPDRDPNPLAIDYQTQDPSIVVNARGSALSAHLELGEVVTPLFAEAEKHRSSNFDVSKLVKQMQELPPYGVPMRDRRWLATTHLKCFRGDDMTTWLLAAFKDLDLRDDAVALGNELMNRGVFTHVRQKHKFRDGHYFYQIAHAHRTTEYPDTQGIFPKINPWRSIPATPMSDHVKSPGLRPFNGTESSSSSGQGTPIIGPAKNKDLLLSQMMLYNVDPQKKINHLQIIDLHYDRIHNPENCYHIQLEWLGASTKLIRDAIARWSGVLDAYGLRLMQIPLEEASKFREHHPFDQPQQVSLVTRPPDKILATPVIEPHNSSPRHVEDLFAYHKALLRSQGFVLDLEAATAFTTDLHVTYSWGPPTYQYTQFVHKSGLVLAQITAGEHSDFLLLPNRVATVKTTSSAKQAETDTAEDIIKSFKAFCRDEEALRRAYSQADKPKPVASPFTTAALGSDFDVPPMNLPPHLLHRSLGHGHRFVG